MTSSEIAAARAAIIALKAASPETLPEFGRLRSAQNALARAQGDLVQAQADWDELGTAKRTITDFVRVARSDQHLLSAEAVLVPPR